MIRAGGGGGGVGDLDALEAPQILLVPGLGAVEEIGQGDLEMCGEGGPVGAAVVGCTRAGDDLPEHLLLVLVPLHPGRVEAGVVWAVPGHSHYHPHVERSHAGDSEEEASGYGSLSSILDHLCFPWTSLQRRAGFQTRSVPPFSSFLQLHGSPPATALKTRRAHPPPALPTRARAPARHQGRRLRLPLQTRTRPRPHPPPGPAKHRG